MDPTIHRAVGPVADAYRAFAEREARGASPTFEEWALGVASDPVFGVARRLNLLTRSRSR